MDTTALKADGIHVTVVDGVPVLWKECGGDPAATLSVRVGQADETLLTRGYTHLAEHVAVEEFARVAWPMNASTGTTVTRFYATASPEELTRFVGGVARRLGRLASADLADDDRAAVLHDAKVLEAEWHQRGPDIVSATLSDLYGAAAFGLTGWNELGLRDLSLPRFQAWIRQRFVPAAAVLTLTFEPPPDLSLAGLPHGDPPSAVDVEPRLGPLPGYRRRNGPFCAIAPVSRSQGASAFCSVLQQALTQRLRHQAGASYAPQVTYETVSATDALVIVVTDIAPGRGTSLASAAVEELERLADHGPHDAELADYRDRYRQAREFESFGVAHLHRNADSLLYGDELRSLSDVERLVDAVDGPSIQETARAVLDRMALSLPLDAELDHPRIHAFPDFAPAPAVTATTTVKPRTPAGAARNAELVLGTDGLTLRDSGRELTVRTHDVAALLYWSDGAQSLVRDDGSEIRIIPGRWHDEERVRAHVADLAGPDAAVHMGIRFAPPDSARPARGPRSGISLWTFGAVLAVLFLIGAAGDPETAAGGVIAATLAAGWAAWELRRAGRIGWSDVYDEARWHVDDPRWTDGTPTIRAYNVGGLKLSWLVDNHLLAPWVEEAGHEHLARFRAGEIDAAALHRELGGVLASDMLHPAAVVFFNFLHMPAVGRPNESMIDRWWRHLGLPADTPFSAPLSAELVARSYAWFDRTARVRFRVFSPFTARALDQARRSGGPSTDG